MKRAAEEALPGASQIVYDFANAWLKNTLRLFVKNVLTEMAPNGALNEPFERSIECWTHISKFMKAFAKRASTSPRLARLAAKFNRKIMRDQDAEKKSKHILVGFPHLVPESPLVFSAHSSPLLKPLNITKRGTDVKTRH